MNECPESEAEAYCRKLDEADPKHHEWRGPEDGLPPVRMRLKSYHHKEVKVVAHDCEDGYWLAICRCINSGDYVGIPTNEFEPIRTKEDKVVEDMMNIIASVTNPSDSIENAIDIIAKSIYRSGYRKQESE